MGRLLPIALALAGLAAAPAPAPAQDAAPPAPAAAPEGDGLRAARERWKGMSPEQRARVLRNFEKWRSLPPDRREALRRRFEDLGGPEGAPVRLATEERARRESPARVERLRLQSEAVRRIEELLVQDLTPEEAARFRALPEEERARGRRRFARRLLEVGREAMLRDHATPEEAAAARGEDPEARRRALQSVLGRVRDEVLGPHRGDLEALPAGDRRRREFLLLEEHFWTGVRAEVRRERAEFLKGLLRPREERGAGPRPGPGPSRNGHAWMEEHRDRFQRDFGVRPEALGSPWPRILLATARYFAPEDRAERAAWFEALRPELRRVADLPEAERPPALRALVERLRTR